jgi:hypothetical protein
MGRRSRRDGLRSWRAALVGLALAVSTGWAAPPPTEGPARGDAAAEDDARSHWAFQPVSEPAPPPVKDVAWCRNPIDRFVLAKLEAKGWRPAPEAPREALLRRVYLDLTGLPPTPEERSRFLDDHSPGAFDRVVDELLARPSYGERWARHWLDLVRYADSNGYERDAEKPFAWRYRDYVIRALNADKPFDQFLTEQLAGDELPGAGAQAVIATGYYRVGPWDDEPADPKQDRFDQLDDVVSTTAEVFLGLTLGCARCHDHKFEPLTSLDYYRMVAVFSGLERPRKERTELTLPVATPEQLRAAAEHERKVEALRRRIAERRDAFRTCYLLLLSGRSRLPEEALEALRAEPGRRTDSQRRLASRYAAALDREVAAAMPAFVRGPIDQDEAEVRRLAASAPEVPRAYVLHEASPRPRATRLLLRGQAASPGPEVAPGVPAVVAPTPPTFPPPGPRTSLRRLTLARWLSRPDHPLTARVFVNRVWQEHLGAGIVRTPSDFGTMGDPPTHPELLDWLAHQFVAGGWSVKRLHRLILTSSTYRMGRRGEADHASEDPEARLLWRLPYRRLDAEAIRDSMLAASGRLNRAMFGPAMYPEVPREALEGHSDPDKVWRPSGEREASRRTVYAFVKRSLVVPMLEALDFCDTSRSSARRNVTSVAPQALTLLNGAFVNRQAAHLAERVIREAGDDPAARVDRAFVLALGRAPSSAEREAMVRFLQDEARELAREAGGAEPSAAARRNALEQLCRAVFNMNEFIYPD